MKVTPQISAAWEHEFKGSYDSVSSGLKLASVERETAVLGAGVGWAGSCGWNAAVGYEARLNNDVNSNQVSLKLGTAF